MEEEEEKEEKEEEKKKENCCGLGPIRGPRGPKRKRPPCGSSLLQIKTIAWKEKDEEN